VLDPLSLKVLGGELVSGDRIVADVGAEGLVFESSSAPVGT
jgi:hydrogenase maturation factor HypE